MAIFNSFLYVYQRVFHPCGGLLCWWASTCLHYPAIPGDQPQSLHFDVVMSTKVQLVV